MKEETPSGGKPPEGVFFPVRAGSKKSLQPGSRQSSSLISRTRSCMEGLALPKNIMVLSM